MPLPSNIKTKKAFYEKYVNSFTSSNSFEFVTDALRNLSDDENYIPLDFNLGTMENSEARSFYGEMSRLYENDRLVKECVEEFDEEHANGPYFTDQEGFYSFMKKLYIHLCEKLWEKFQTKYPEEFNESFAGFKEELSIELPEDEEVNETMSAITDLIGQKKLVLPEGVSQGKVRELLLSLKNDVKRQANGFKEFPSEEVWNRYKNNRRKFREDLKELDKILTPGLTEGEDAPFDEEYYFSTNGADMDDILRERLDSIREFWLAAHPTEENLEKMMEKRFTVPKNLIEFKNDALLKLYRCREELLASDHFFQKSSQEFKDMKDALEIAIKDLRGIKKADFTPVDVAEIRKKIKDKLDLVSEKTNAYLLYKENGPTGLFGASRFAAAKSIREAIRSLRPAVKKDKIMNDCSANIRKIFGASKPANQENMNLNLSEASRKIAGYIAPCSGTDMERYKAFYMFDEDFDRDYVFARENRIDLVLDYLKHPDEATALIDRVEVTKNNYKPIKDAKIEDFTNDEKALGYRYVGVSYAIKGLIDKIMEKKAPDTDMVILGEMVKVLNEDLETIKDIELSEKFRSAIDENTRYVEAVIATTDFLKKALSLEERGKLIGSLKGNPNAKREYTNQEYNALMKTPTTGAELNTILGYSYFKSFNGGMNAVIGMVDGFQKASPEWSWEQTAEKLRDRNPEIEKTFKELLAREKNEEQKEVKGKTYISGGSGHIMRNYQTALNNFKKIICAKDKEPLKTVKENNKQMEKTSGPMMK